VNDIVVDKPDNNTVIIATSCAPKPVNRVLAENGVIKVHPDIVDILLEHLIACIFKRYKTIHIKICVLPRLPRTS